MPHAMEIAIRDSKLNSTKQRFRPAYLLMLHHVNLSAV